MGVCVVKTKRNIINFPLLTFTCDVAFWEIYSRYVYTSTFTDFSTRDRLLWRFSGCGPHETNPWYNFVCKLLKTIFHQRKLCRWWNSVWLRMSMIKAEPLAWPMTVFHLKRTNQRDSVLEPEPPAKPASELHWPVYPILDTSSNFSFIGWLEDWSSCSNYHTHSKAGRIVNARLLSNHGRANWQPRPLLSIFSYMRFDQYKKL